MQLSNAPMGELRRARPLGTHTTRRPRKWIDVENAAGDRKYLKRWVAHQCGEYAACAHKRALTGTHRLVSAETPGKSLPSSNSKEAPPPVLQCVTLSSVPYFLHAVAVSPPPMTVITPAAVASTTVSINFLVPASNLAISKTPMGPFQMMVFESMTALALASMDFGPQSRPMNPSGMPVSFVASLTSPSSPNFDEMTKSTGRMNTTLSFPAFSMICGTIFAPSSSYRDVPIAIPSLIFRNVYAMPPPMIIL